MPSSKHVLLLTGCTGFLGGSVLADFLQTSAHTHSRLLLLVRAPTPSEGLERVWKSLRKFKVSEELIELIRVENIICGGLTNVPEYENDPRLQKVTEVINCAGITSFGPHPEVWTTNVDGTLAFGKMVAKLPHLRRFLHVSTAMICGSKPPSLVKEEMNPSHGLRHFVPYTESKTEAEFQLRAQLKGCPLVIIRPTIVVGHTKLGCGPSGSIFWAFRMSDAIGMVTAPVTSRIDVVPVDYVSGALLQLAMAKTVKHDCYHLGSGDSSSCTFAEISEAFCKAIGPRKGYKFRQAEFQEAAALQPDFYTYFGRCNKRFMLGAMRLYGSFASLNAAFDNSRSLAEGIPQSPRFTDYIEACVRSSEHITIADQAAIDFQ